MSVNAGSTNTWNTAPLLFLAAQEVRARADDLPEATLVLDGGAIASGAVPPLLRLVSLGTLQETEAVPGLGDPMPNAIVLAGCGGLADLQAADVALGVVEAEAGVPAGQIGIIIVIGADPRGVLGCDTLAGGSRRLAGVVLDEDALASALGLRPDARRVSSAPLMLARGRAVLMAADAGVPSYCFLPAGEVQPAILAHLIRVAADDGFTTVAARGLAQWEALSGA